jgi:hypothetical protein
MTPYVDWAGKGEAAEAAGDWHEAKRCWYYAAQQTDNRYGMRTYYCDREDLAGRIIAQATRTPDLTIRRHGSDWSITPHTAGACTFLLREIAHAGDDRSPVRLDIIREWAETLGFVVDEPAA